MGDIKLKPRERYVVSEELVCSFDKSVAKIDKIWLEESAKRLVAYQSGSIKTVSYEAVFDSGFKLGKTDKRTGEYIYPPANSLNNTKCPLQCSHKNCHEPVYENKKCIFHCVKDDWYYIQKYTFKREKQIWFKSKGKITVFWNCFSEKIKEPQAIVLSNYIFPVFLEESVFIVPSTFTNKIKFEECVFLSKAEFLQQNFASFVDFYGCQFNSGLTFYDCTFDKGFKFKNCRYEKSIHLDLIRLNSYSCFENSITLNTDIVFKNITAIDDLLFSSIGNDVHPQSIANFIIKECYIADKTTVSFYFSNTGTLDNLIIEGCDNHGNLKFANLRVEGTVIIENCDLGKTSFSNLYLHSCKNIAIETNILLDTLWNNVNWGNKNRIKASRDEFRQLKFAYDKQSNYIEANEFYALEMKAKEKELKQTKGFSQDKFVFWLGGIISDHGTNWLKAIKWIFGFGAVMFFCYQWRTDNYLFDLDALFNYGQYYDGFIGFLDDFAKFMNPFSRKMDETANTGYAIWLTHKVFSGFLVYHFIVSLRRNTKR